MKYKNSSFKLLLVLMLVVPSVLLYLAHYLFFHDTQYIAKDLLAQLAFLPIYYLITTIVIDSIIVKNEKRKLSRKVYMLVGLFFSEIGLQLLIEFSKLDMNMAELKNKLVVRDAWSRQDFAAAVEYTKKHSYSINVTGYNFVELKSTLQQKKAQLIDLLENQYLMEHEGFTDMVLAVFHLCEELEYREIGTDLRETDISHLSMDILRAYRLLVCEWLMYMEHLKVEYPFLYSLAMKKNPFA